GWPDLSGWIAKHQPKPVATADTVQSQSSSAVASGQGPTPAEPQAAVGSVQSETQLLQVQKQLLNHYQEKSKHGSRAALARSVKWADLQLPPNENGKTRIPAPRETSLNKIALAVDSEDWTSAFQAAEEAFFEPGGLFCMELQRLSAQAAQKAGYRSARSVIEFQVRELMDRLPKLKQLSYDNGDPFVGGAALAWIEQLAATGANTPGSQTETDYLAEARQQRDDASLAEALAWLKTHISGDNLTSLRIRLAQAQLCHESGEPGLARSLLDRLDAAVEEYRLAQLVPGLAMDIWRQAWLVSKDLVSTAKEEQKAELNNRMERLQARMCATDLAQAAQWF
ncbi:MAG: type VI secretion system domain-containing protein, partial [Pseudohongiellaceae bacterium]